MADEAVTGLVFDARRAEQGAAAFQAAGQKVIEANRRVEASEATKTAAMQKAANEAGVMVRSTDRVVTSLNSQSRFLDQLARKYDPFVQAIQRAQTEVNRLNGIIAAGPGEDASSRRAENFAKAAGAIVGAQQRLVTAGEAAAASFSASASTIARLTEKFDPATASAKRMAAEIAELNAAQRAGVNIAGGYAAALAQITGRYDLGAQAAKRASAAQAEMIAQARAAQAAQNAQAAHGDFNRFMGVNPASGTGSAAASASVFQEAFQEQERLAAAAQKYKDQLTPLLPLQRAYKAELAAINEVAAAGLLTQAQVAAAVTRTKAGFADQVQTMTGAAAKARETAAANADLARQAQGLKDRIDPLAAAQRAHADAVSRVSAMGRAGLLTQIEQARAVDLLVKGHKEHQAALLGATQASRGMSFAATNLTFQINDVVSGLAMGQRPMQIFTQQAGQFVQLFQQGGGVRSVVGEVTSMMARLVTPTTLAAAGVATLAVGFGVLVSRAAEAEGAVRRFDVQMRGLGRERQAVGADLEAAAKRLRDVGLAASEARTALFEAQAAGLTPTGAERVVRAGQNLIPVLGEAAAGQFMSAVASRSVESLGRLGQQLSVVSAAEIVAAREAARFGQEMRILDDWVGRVERQVTGLNREALSPIGQQLRDLKNNVSDLLDRMAQNDVITGTVRLLNNMADALKFIFDLKPPEWFNRLMMMGGQGQATNFWGFPMGPQREFTAPIPPPLAAPSASASPTGGVSSVTVDQALAIIRRYENASGNPMLGWGNTDLSGYPLSATGFPMWPGKMGPAGNSTAAGLYQITRSTWDPIARGQGITDFSAASQTSVATELFNTRGFQPWTVGNPKLAAAIADQKLLNAEVAKSASVYADAGRSAEAAAAEQSEAFKKLSDASNLEAVNALRVAEAWRVSAKEGMTAEATAKALTEAYHIYGAQVLPEVLKTEEGYNALIARRNQILKPVIEAQRQRNAQDALAQRDTQDTLRFEIALTGQTTEQIQRQVTLLQAKQTIERDFPFLTEQEKQNRIAMVSATADLNVKLAETQRNQQRIDDIFRSIGDTISRSIGDVIEGIFDPSKAKKWGDSLRGIVSSIGNQILQSMVIRPLTGTLLAGLGASPQVVQGFGTFGGSGAASGGGISTGTLLQGGGLLKDVFGGNLFGGSSSSGGMFGGVGNWFNGLGSSLGFGTSVPGMSEAGIASFGNLIGIEPSSLGFLGNAGTIPGSVFGSTTLGGALGGIGLGAGAGGLIASLMGGNSMFGSLGGGALGLAGTLIGGPIGGLIGGALGGLLGGLFKKKPPNQSAGGNINLTTGAAFDLFSGGNSQIDQAVQGVVQQVSAFTASLLQASGGTLPLTGHGSLLIQNGVNTGFTVDSDLPGFAGRFELGKDAGAAAETIMRGVLGALTDVSDTVRTIIDHTQDLSKLAENLAFAKVYDNINDAFKSAFANIPGEIQAGPFEQARDQIKATFDELIKKTLEFGLAVEPVNAALAEASKRLTQDFNTSVQDAITGLADPLRALVDEERKAGEARLREARAVNGNIAEVNRLNAQRLDAIWRQQTASLDQLLAELKGGELSGGTIAQRLAAANETYASELRLVQAGNFGKIPDLAAAAQALIELSQEGYGNGPATADLRNSLIDALTGVQAQVAAEKVATLNQIQEAAAITAAAGSSVVINSATTTINADTVVAGPTDLAAAAAAAITPDSVPSEQAFADAVYQNLSADGGEATGSLSTPAGRLLVGEIGPEWMLSASARAMNDNSAWAQVGKNGPEVINQPAGALILPFPLDPFAAMAQAGRAFARGTMATPPGTILVGEEGPELMYQPGGAQIWPADETERMLTRGLVVPGFAAGTDRMPGPPNVSDTAELLGELRKLTALLAGNTRVTQIGLAETVDRLERQLVEMQRPATVAIPRRRAA